MKEKQHLSRAVEKKGEREAPPIRRLAVVDVVARAPSPAGTSAAEVGLSCWGCEAVKLAGRE
ncbi:hypothetical protein DEO72_LG10g2390 [Vigna unguiculata]|uniref:Uncharacterized protein n=1 Tax=Vigna unguiculata TaxID=3917 RepID=A0A4D6NGU6_VIGUN|nr:hypothetical protein DEO72_LG10g2390 [Vigna unguiculata]